MRWSLIFDQSISNWRQRLCLAQLCITLHFCQIHTIRKITGLFQAISCIIIHIDFLAPDWTSTLAFGTQESTCLKFDVDSFVGFTFRVFTSKFIVPELFYLLPRLTICLWPFYPRLVQEVHAISILRRYTNGCLTTWGHLADSDPKDRQSAWWDGYLCEIYSPYASFCLKAWVYREIGCNPLVRQK